MQEKSGQFLLSCRWLRAVLCSYAGRSGKFYSHLMQVEVGSRDVYKNQATLITMGACGTCLGSINYSRWQKQTLAMIALVQILCLVISAICSSDMQIIRFKRMGKDETASNDIFLYSVTMNQLFLDCLSIFFFNSGKKNNNKKTTFTLQPHSMLAFWIFFKLLACSFMLNDLYAMLRVLTCFYTKHQATLLSLWLISVVFFSS